MATKDNLQEAFAGESQANRSYLAFAKKAQAEGFPQVAKLFRAAAEAETVHAHAHLRVLKGVGSTEENVAGVIEGEGFEFREMYPKMLQEAKDEGENAAVTSFANALAVEEIHHNLYSEALAAVKAGNDLSAQPIYVCGICGNTVHAVPDACPVCGATASNFTEIE